MLLGRQSEQDRIARLVDSARLGMSGSLAFYGEAGVGMTALLARWHHVPDFTTLSVCGLEPESTIAGAALLTLLRPILDHLDQLTDEQSATLSGALAIGPARPIDRFALGAATLALLSSAAKEHPMLVVVDSLHFVDSASREALVFAARRLGQERLAMLFAMRSETSSAELAGLEQIRLSGLDTVAAGELIDSLTADDPSSVIVPAAIAQIVERTGGNPLAIVEVVAALSDRQRAGLESIEESLRVGDVAEEAYRVRLAVLPAETRLALLVAAITDPPDERAVLPACWALGLTSAALGPAEADRLITVGPLIEFGNPLVRAVVLSRSAAEDRRRIHLVLADLPTNLLDDDRRTWHLARATVVPDERVAARLVKVAESSADRGDLTASARAYQRAADLSVSPLDRTRRLVSAGVYGAHAGIEGRPALIDARASTNDPRRRAEISLGLAVLDLLHPRRSGPGDTATLDPSAPRSLAAAARSLEAIEAWKAADLGRMAKMASDGLAMSDRSGAAGYQPGNSGWELLAPIVKLWSDALSGQVSDQSAELAKRCVELTEGSGAVEVAGILADALIALDQLKSAERVVSTAVPAARRDGKQAALAWLLVPAAEIAVAAGDLVAARTLAQEALDVSRAAGGPLAIARSLTVVALLDAVAGADAAANAGVDGAHELLRRFAAPIGWPAGEHVRALIEVGRGRFEDAAIRLERLQIRMDRVGLITASTTAQSADLVEALVNLERIDEAASVAEEVTRRAGKIGGRSVLALAARAAALVAADETFDEAAADATHLGRVGEVSSFESARTNLVIGERLARMQRPGEARPALQRAIAGFAALGARPWIERTDRTLAQLDGGRGDRTVAGVSLSSQEYQVAKGVSEGRSNKEIADALSLSTKTVESHLTRAFRKVGVRSRAQLALLVARGEVSVADGTADDPTRD